MSVSITGYSSSHQHHPTSQLACTAAKNDKKGLLSQRWLHDAPYKAFTLILFTLTATILCTDFDSERI